MPIYNWECLSCLRFSRKVLKVRPQLTICECGGEQNFVSNLSSRIIEIRDNGLQDKVVEQLKDIKELVTERNSIKSDGDII
jgi:hypothetical protein